MNARFTMIGILVVFAAGAALIHAQGRGGPEWTTGRSDAQRTGWMRADPRISVATMLKPGEFGPFKFLWKLKLEHDPKAPTALTQPVLLTNVVGFRGFKAIAYIATASQTVHAIDYDFGTPLWKYHINYSASPPPLIVGTPDCPIAMTAAPTRPTPIISTAAGRGGAFGRGGGSGGGVGEPGTGATTIAVAGQAGPGGTPPPPPVAGAAGTGAVPGSAAAAAGNQPGGLPPGAARGGGAGAPFAPGGDAAYVVGTDGYLHALNIQNGWDNMTPALFLPANTRAIGLIVATSDTDAVAYAATTNRCGSQPDAVWAMDLSSPQKTVTAFRVDRAVIVGSDGPALGRDGTVYIATGEGNDASSNTLFALAPKTLTVKSRVKIANAQFMSSPLVFPWKGKDAVLVAGGGKIYLIDPANSGGPLAVSAALGTPAPAVSALASWEDTTGTRWVAARGAGGVRTFKLAEQNGAPAFVAGWTSPAIPSALPPLVVNGVLFTASSGTRAVPSVLYALDAATGKTLWTSGTTIPTTIRGGLAAGQGNVYVPGADGTLYAFGFDIEK